jgi:type 1 glutamine amidotransferase
MHPEYGPAAIHILPGSGPLVAGIPDFKLLDERYSWLRTAPGIKVHATHTHDGVEHPVMWSLERGNRAQCAWTGNQPAGLSTTRWAMTPPPTNPPNTANCSAAPSPG